MKNIEKFGGVYIPYSKICINLYIVIQLLVGIHISVLKFEFPLKNWVTVCKEEVKQNSAYFYRVGRLAQKNTYISNP